MNVALVYDRVNKWGGAERVLLALHELWPDAPLYTAVYDRKRAGWADVFSVRPSFLNRIPWARANHELLAPVTPMAFETFRFEGFDVVISVTSAEAKSVITRPETLHICYCLTPTRYLWSGTRDYLRSSGGLFGGVLPGVLKVGLPRLRRWDYLAAQRPDRFIAISDTVRRRIERYYGRTVAAVIYPPVNVDRFRGPAESDRHDGTYYLMVARHVGYKRLDIVVDAFTRLGWPLVVIGRGREKSGLMHRAGPTVRFVTRHLTDTELADYYYNCRAFVYAGVEDFGIAAVEAQAAGKPVFTYRHSGMAETVIEGKTGDFFDLQTSRSLERFLISREHASYLPDLCRRNAERFSAAAFRKQMAGFVRQSYEKRRNML